MATLNPNALRRNSATSSLEKLKASMEKKMSFGEDENLWKAPVDPKTKEGWAIVKFLPAKYEDDMPFITTYNHGFRENGQWYIHECGTTVGKQCPVCEENRKLWSTGNESDKDVVRSRRRNTRYYANILIIKDTMNPENEGKVKVWRFGNAIFNKIQECISGNPMLGQEAKDPFSFFDSCEFRFISQNNKGGFANYDKSTFVPCGDLFDGDETKLMEVLEQCHDLNYYKRDELYDYDRQKARFLRVTGAMVENSMSADDFRSSTDYGSRFDGGSAKEDDLPFETAKPAVRQSAPKAPAVEDEPSNPFGTGDSSIDDDMEFFKKIANS